MITMTPPERHFFEMLNEELNKVDKFYLERERDAFIFSSLLKKQLQELRRRVVDVREPMLHISQCVPFISSYRILKPCPPIDGCIHSIC